MHYRDTDGRTITDPATLERIRGLVIPPAWQDVWISPDPRGHIQATATDAAGRKQYLYLREISGAQMTAKDLPWYCPSG